MPSSHGRTHEAASTRPPTSTTHMRQTPTGGRRGSWQRTGTSTPAERAASQIVVPSGTAAGRPSIVNVTRRTVGPWAIEGGTRGLSHRSAATERVRYEAPQVRPWRADPGDDDHSAAPRAPV